MCHFNMRLFIDKQEYNLTDMPAFSKLSTNDRILLTYVF